MLPRAYAPMMAVMETKPEVKFCVISDFYHKNLIKRKAHNNTPSDGEGDCWGEYGASHGSRLSIKPQDPKKLSQKDEKNKNGTSTYIVASRYNVNGLTINQLTINELTIQRILKGARSEIHKEETRSYYQQPSRCAHLQEQLRILSLLDPCLANSDGDVTSLY